MATDLKIGQVNKNIIFIFYRFFAEKVWWLRIGILG
jgi:hypothetical protein